MFFFIFRYIPHTYSLCSRCNRIACTQYRPSPQQMTRPSKKNTLASGVLVATLGTTSGFQRPFIPGRAAAVRLKQAEGRTPLSFSSSARARQAKSVTSMSFGSDLFGDGLMSGIFGGKSLVSLVCNVNAFSVDSIPLATKSAST